MHLIKISVWPFTHHVLLITSVGGPLVAWVVLGIQVTEGRLINVDLTPIGLDRILFELETNLFTICRLISLCCTDIFRLIRIGCIIKSKMYAMTEKF